MAAPVDPSPIVSRCVTVGPGSAKICAAGRAAQPVALLRRPVRTAPAALQEPGPDLLPVALSRGAGSRPPRTLPPPKADPQQTPAVMLPRPGPDVSALHRAHSVLRRGAKATAQGIERVEDAVSRLRPQPWRTGFDASGWGLTTARLMGMTPIGGEDEVIPVVPPYPAARPAMMLRLRWNAGFDGAQVTDFALPGLFASRLLVARYHHGPVLRVKTSVGTVLVPMPRSEPAILPLRRLFPIAASSGSGLILANAGSDLPVPAPVPLPPAAPMLALPLIGLGLMARRRRSRRESSAENAG